MTRTYTPPPDPFAPDSDENPDDFFAEVIRAGEARRADGRRYYQEQADEARRSKKGKQ